jgi:hypothetical protein
MMRSVIFALCFFWMGASFCLAEEKDDFEHQDSRFFIVYHHEDANPGMVQGIIRRGEDYLEEFREKLGLDPFGSFAELTDEEKIKVYLHRTQGSYQEEGPSWSAGNSQPASKSIYGYPHMDFSTSILPHELGHILFYEAIGAESFARAPLWLSEGVSCYLERGSGKWMREPYVKEALMKNTFVPLSGLDKFRERSGSGEEINLFYSESTSVVNFLIENYGLDSFKTFCSGLKEGKSIDEAIASSFSGLNGLEDLGTTWESYLRKRLGH